MREVLNAVINGMIAFLYRVFRIFPIKNNKIVFASYLGKGFGDNGKYIALALLELKKNCDIVWLVREKGTSFPEGIRRVRYGSIQSVYEMATARIWVDNRRKPLYVRKRKGQFYIMTWHADSVLKKVEKDVESALTDYYVRSAKNDSKMIDVFLSSCTWETNLYRRAFWYDGEILETGYPRQDILYQYNGKMIEDIKSSLGFDQDVKLVLYAPTFRKNMESGDLGIYHLDWEKLLAALCDRFGGKWVGLIRLHPNVAALSNKLNLPQGILDVSGYNDAQELIVSSDCIITDYSSIIIEAAIAGKAGFIYAPDFEEYKKDRDVYFRLEEMPFPLAETEQQLLKEIDGFQEESYRNNVRMFLEDRLGMTRKGRASQAAAELICSEIEKTDVRGNRIVY